MNGVSGVRKGGWTAEEDVLLKQCIEIHGEGQWHKLPSRAGLNRCRKSCRVRWLNYLKPNIKKGQFEEDEVDLITKLHKLLGNKWSLIAGRLPGRTTNSVKNFWNASLRRNVASKPTLETKFPGMEKTLKTKAIRPQSQYLSKNFIFKNEKTWDGESRRQFGELNGPTNSSSSQTHQAPDPWGSEHCEMELWDRVLAELEYNNGRSTSISGPDSYREQKWNGVSMGERETAGYDTQDTWKHDISFNIELWNVDNS